MRTQHSGPGEGSSDAAANSDTTLSPEPGSDPLGRPEQVRDDDEEQSLDRLVEQGRPRLHRTLQQMWVATLVGNLAGDWIVAWLIILGFPHCVRPRSAMANTSPPPP